MSKEYDKIFKKAQKVEVTPQEVGRLLIKDMLSKLKPPLDECRDEAIASLPQLVQPLTNAEIASLTESTTAPWIACYNGLFYLRERVIRLACESQATANLVTLALISLKQGLDNDTLKQDLEGTNPNTFRNKRQEIVERLAYWYAIGIYCDMLSRHLRIPHIRQIITCDFYNYSMHHVIDYFNKTVTDFAPMFKDNKLTAYMLKQVEPIVFEYNTSYALDHFYRTFNIERTLSLEGVIEDINTITLSIFIPSNISNKQDPIGGKICYNEPIK